MNKLIMMFLITLVISIVTVKASVPQLKVINYDGDLTVCDNSCPKVYYKGKITLKPGFHAIPGAGQEVHIIQDPEHTIANKYDNFGNITEQNVDNGEIVYTYGYDNQARLQTVSTKAKAETNPRLEAQYNYNAADQTSIYKYSQYNSEIDYSYDPIRGWLTGINNGNNFSESLTYNDNGNINTQTVSNSIKGSIGFTYTYDDFNRLWTSTSSGNYSIYNENYTYGNDGGLLSKIRNGQNIGYTYQVNNHQLDHITYNSVPKYFGYDDKGNIINDGLTNASIGYYDDRNLPRTITTNAGQTIYSYNDEGNRIYKINDQGTLEYYLNNQAGKTLIVYDLCSGNIEEANIQGADLIGKIENVENTTPGRYYYLIDHLGSIRVTLLDAAGTLNVVHVRDYYPYGESIDGRTQIIGADQQKYLFTEKERDAESGYDYFGARYNSSTLGTWLQADPLAEKYPGSSPYNYAIDNPLKFIDPTGETIRINTGQLNPDGSTNYITYSLGMSTDGCPDFIKEIVDELDYMYMQVGGDLVIKALMKKESGNFDFQQGGLSKDAESTSGEFQPNHKGGVIALNDYGINTTAHETFHAYQQLKHQGGESIFGEIQAFTFADIMSHESHNYGSTSGDLRNDMKDYKKTLYGHFLSKATSDFREEWTGTGYSNSPLILSHQNKNLLRIIMGKSDDWSQKYTNEFLKVNK